jgi:hypothetical protein
MTTNIIKHKTQEHHKDGLVANNTDSDDQPAPTWCLLGEVITGYLPPPMISHAGWARLG